eukprot:Hpha_TRINITY_DN4260_c0_g2::TRINITY_DN4260_c0_g2_i1::g.186620::m.186620
MSSVRFKPGMRQGKTSRFMFGVEGGGGPLYQHIKQFPRSDWAAGPSQEGTGRGPTHMRQAAGYYGNCPTPNWLFTDENGTGDEWFQKAQELFKGRTPSTKSTIGRHKLRLQPGKASAGPPVGPVFSSMGVKALDFVKEFNARTTGVFANDPDIWLKVHIYFYEDKTYQFTIGPPSTMNLIRRASGLPKISQHTTWGGGKPLGPENPKYEGMVTLQQLYHAAAFTQSFKWGPDQYSLDLMVANMIPRCRKQGLLVLGVDTRPQPVEGKTEDEVYAEYEKKKTEWIAKRMADADADPSRNLPWYPQNSNLRKYKRAGRNIKDFLKGDGEEQKKKVVKEAQVIDSNYQKMLEEQEKESVGTDDKAFMVDWDLWKRTGLVHRKGGRNDFGDPQVQRVKARYLEYLSRRFPDTLPRTNYLRSMWMADTWDKYLPVGADTEGTGVR